jgi:hypothetical protein
LCYIGSSYDARRRFQSGKYNDLGSWWPEVRVVLVENHPTRALAYAAELRAQRKAGLAAKGSVSRRELYTEQPGYLTDLLDDL